MSNKTIMFGNEELTVNKCFKCGKKARRSPLFRLISWIMGDTNIYVGQIVCAKCFKDI